ncbi:MAG: NADAR family protein [Desulfovibrionaceae bacterium]|nr:NADAR family protein [Desulfovibrionaceae bacterium]MBO4793972.1 NADAR family protein [Deltaproteobacteria bacterium]
MQIVCFHNPDEENGFLSNWHRSRFTACGREFSSMEQYMMCQKALCFHDEESARQIMESSDPARIKALGRQVAGYNEHWWNGVRQIIVYEGLLAKFSQNAELKARLLETGSALLAECAVKDRIWGIGLSMDDPARLDPAKWKGQNLLGYALMMARANI